MNVVITGASGAIGSALAERLANAGHRVLGTACTAPRLITLDLRDERSIARAAEEILGRLGGEPLHALVNNAGLSVDGPLELVPPQALRDQFEINVLGHVALTQLLLPALREAPGRIVNVGGGAGRLTLPMFGGLSASKAALDSLTDALRMELAPQGIRVSYVEPGAVATEFFAKSRARSPLRDTDATALYAPAIAAAADNVVSRPSSPDAVARAIERALTARRPRARYVVGGQMRAALRVLPHLPPRLRDRIMRASLGLATA
jgi:NAD(P)-dependent dehydrogenase (short-subunit alcohol dehydrogenase family)